MPARRRSEVSEGCGLSVSVRKGELENVERNRDKSLGVTLFVGQRRGNASSSDFSRQAVEQTVRAAYDIARFTAEDPAAGLPEPEDIATPQRSGARPRAVPSLGVDADAAAELARRCEAAAFATDRGITNSEGAGVSAQQSHFWAGNSRGFRGGYASSRHSISVAPIAGRGSGMQRDAWYSSMRDAARAVVARGRGPLRGRARAVAAARRARSAPARCRCCSSRRWSPG